MDITKDKGLIGNEKIEEYLKLLKQEPSDEVLSVLLTSIRRRMQEKGQFVVSVEPNAGTGMQVRVLNLADGRKVIPAYTSFDEELKGGSSIMSAFTADIGQLFEMILQNTEADGILLNPWGNHILLDKNVIRVIKG